MNCLTLFCLVLIPAASLAAQQPAPSPSPSPAPLPAGTPTFAAGVEQVIVDTVVVDKKGMPIKGLTQADFTVLEDGKPQEIVSFESVELPAAPAAKPTARPIISSNQRREDRTGRTFILVFDDIQMTRFQGIQAKAAAASFLKTGVREGDRVSLVATGGGAWWSTRMEAGKEELINLLKRLDGRLQPEFGPERMSDYEAMRIQVYNDMDVMGRVSRRFESLGASPSQGRGRGGSNTLGDPLVRGRASEMYFKSVSRNRITLEVMRRVLDSLQATKGRKSMILVSQGFIYDPNLSEFKDVVQASRRGNTAIYFVDSRGLTGLSDFYSAEFGGSGTDNQDLGSALLDTAQASEGAESLASDTGGFTVKNTNDLAAAIGRIASETQSYYLIGYNPTNTKQDGRFRKIQVKVPRKGTNVRARKGYYAPLDGKSGRPSKPGENDPAIQEALDSPFELDRVPIRMTAYAFDEALLGKLNALVAADVDIRGFAFEEAEGRFVDSLEFLMVVAHRETGEFFQYNQKIEMKLLPKTKEKLDQTWFSMSRDFELAPGGYQAKLVVRDKNSGRVGTVIHEFDVPDPAEFRASTLNLTDALDVTSEVAASGAPRPSFLARREFPSGVTLYAQFSVYGAERDKTSGMPQASAGYDIMDADGLPRARVNPTVINPTSLGKLSRLVGTPLERYEPGVYEFVLNIKDEIAVKSIQIRQQFTVVAPPAVASTAAAAAPSPSSP